MGEPYQDLLSSWEGDDVVENLAESDFTLPMTATVSSARPATGSPSPRSSEKRKARTLKQNDAQQPVPEEKIVGYWQSAIAAERRKAASSLHRNSHGNFSANRSFDVEKSPSLNGDGSSKMPPTEEVLPVAFEIARTKNLRKAVDYLIACNFLTPSPRDVAAFLRLHRTQLDQSALGIFLAEGGNNGGDVEYWNQIRFNYFRPISFVGMNVEQG